MAWLDRFYSWFYRVIPGKWEIVDVLDAADLVPDELPNYGAVLVGSKKRPKWIVFDCPCLSGHRIMLTLDRTHNPHWEITNFTKLSIWPSVDYGDAEKRCHYVIRHGRTYWVKDNIL